jgi:hypothetical protein
MMQNEESNYDIADSKSVTTYKRMKFELSSSLETGHLLNSQRDNYYYGGFKGTMMGGPPLP